MRKRSAFAVVLALVAVSAATWWTTRAPEAAQQAMSPVEEAAFTPALAALQATPQARTHRDRQRFEAEVRDFFARAPSQRRVERSERADALSRRIDDYEAGGGLSAGEAVLLRTALVQATVEDPARQAEAVAAIADRYRAHADQRMAVFAAQQRNDTRFQSYKAREAQVVSEVMAMTSVPAGLTRDQYLRQRLQEERERAYAP